MHLLTDQLTLLSSVDRPGPRERHRRALITESHDLERFGQQEVEPLQ